MKSLSARGIIPACAITVACAAAAALPVTASAAVEQCGGSAIRGKGSSAQKLLQKEIWNKDFNKSGNPLACNGTQGTKGTPVVSYESTGSGKGLESWGVEQAKPGAQELWFAGKNAFIGTEIGPNKKQEEEITKHTEGAKVLTIPVAQPAIAILFHLPKGCTVEGGPATTKGVIALKDKTLEEIFEGKITAWSKVLNKAKFAGTEAKACKKASITRVVREDGSGTTDAFKKYLGVLNKSKPVYESGETWSQNGEKTANTEWPKEKTDPVVKGNGGGGLVEAVEKTEGSIGFANVADARSKVGFQPVSEGGKGGPGTSEFWAEVENAKNKYANPSTNGEVKTKSNSNCEETVYTNGTSGKKTFPPPSTEELWNEVTIGTVQKNYEPCYLTYDLALTHYKGASKEAFAGTGETELAEPTEEEAATVKNYIQYELSTAPEGAQEAALGEDYLGDPTNSTAELNVLAIARKGAEKIGF